jgi:hypothetical protein
MTHGPLVKRHISMIMCAKSNALAETHSGIDDFLPTSRAAAVILSVGAGGVGFVKKSSNDLGEMLGVFDLCTAQLSRWPRGLIACSHNVVALVAIISSHSTKKPTA